MTRAQYTDEQRDKALSLYREHGPGEASRRTGVPSATIRTWANRAGIAGEVAGQRRAAVEAAQLTMAQRRANLASALLQDADLLRRQLWAPTIERKALVVPQGGGRSTVQVVAIELSEPTFYDKRQILTGVAIVVDKVNVLAPADAARNHRDESPLERRRRIAERLNELVNRRLQAKGMDPEEHQRAVTAAALAIERGMTAEQVEAALAALSGSAAQQHSVRQRTDETASTGRPIEGTTGGDRSAA
jgi:hypothetical protein